MQKQASNSQFVMRASALIAALLLLLAFALRWEGMSLKLHPGAVLFVAIGFAVFAALVWGANLRMRRLESDKRELALDFRTVLDATPDGVIVFDKDGVIRLATQRAEAMFGYEPGELLGSPLDRLVPERVRDKHIARREAVIRQATENPVIHGERMIGRRKDDSEFLAGLSVGARHTAAGTTMTLVVEDISEQARREAELSRIHRALRLLSEANQAMHRATCQMELLDEICSIIIRIGGYRFAWIGYAENDAAKAVTPVAFAGFEDGFPDEAKVSWDDASPAGQGAIGTTIRSGRPVIVRNIAAEARMTPWRDALLKRGYASLASFPLRIDDTVGALAIYSAAEDAFGKEECDLLEDLGYDRAQVIEKLRQTDPADYQAVVDVGIEGLKVAVEEMPGIPTFGYLGFITWDQQYWKNWPGSENAYSQPYPHWGPFKYQTPFLEPTGNQ